MRRGYLYSRAKELGCNKIALGHHYDDVIETILMGMLYGGQVQTIYLDPPFNTGKQFDMKARIGEKAIGPARPASACPLMTTAGRIARNTCR